MIKITYSWHCCVIHVHRVIPLCKQESCHIHSLAVFDGNPRSCLILIFTCDTKASLLEWKHTDQVLCFAFSLTLQHSGRFTRCQIVQGWYVQWAGLSLPPCHRVHPWSACRYCVFSLIPNSHQFDQMQLLVQISFAMNPGLNQLQLSHIKNYHT